jgi:DNA (cytosine-5)-methyltransferase 1
LDAETETLIPTIGGGFDVAPTMMTSGDSHSGYKDEHGLIVQPAIATTTAFKVRGGCDGGGKGYLGSDETAFTLSTGHDQDVFHQMQVRRLTPRECERLQGFADDYTNIPGASDTTRYKALGNSMAVNVMQAIGERIRMVSEIPALEIAA